MDDVELVIVPPVHDLGDGFTVRRALPSAKRRMVGPFIFFDRMGPVVLNAGKGLDVRPHPHIGLATVTYLLEGEIMHRDSLGKVQAIRPGEINWMTAGSGIAHSERTSDEVRRTGGPVSGFQTWVALPADQEEIAPDFAHYKASEIPRAEASGVSLNLVAGSIDGMTSPVRTASPTLFVDIQLADGATYRIGADYAERALYAVHGAIEIVGQEGSFPPEQLVVLKPGAEIVVRAKGQTRFLLAGGEPFPEKRYIYWNFVSSRRERIEQAKEDWRNDRFAHVPGESEFIPLPPDPAGVTLVP